MTDTATVRFEPRMMIDGKLVDGESGTFNNINPATEEVLGEVADASKADMHRAIDAARRAFDETDWSTNKSCASGAFSSCRRPRGRKGGDPRGAHPRGRLPPGDDARPAARCTTRRTR